MVSVNVYDTLYASSILERAGKNQGCCKVALAACGGSHKGGKEAFRGHPEPRQRASRPLHSRCSLLFQKDAREMAPPMSA